MGLFNQPAEPRHWWRHFQPTAHYLMEIEAHVFALAISASVLLSFYPFLQVMLSVFRDVLRWPSAVNAMYLAIKDVFPGRSGDVVAQNLQPWMVPHLRVTTMLLLLFTSNGIFEPLEVALNRAWGVKVNRGYVKNQMVSLGLIFVCGALTLIALMFTALSMQWVTGWLGSGDTATWVSLLVSKLAAVPLTSLALFLIYWLLPNRKVDPGRVAPVAIWVGLILEALKYINVLLRPVWTEKLEGEYHMFQYSVTILLASFIAAMVVLAGAEWTARHDRADPLSESEPEKA